MTKDEQIQLVPCYGNAILDECRVMDRQEFKHDLVFVWNEESTHLDEIKVINISDTLMVDINKKYRFILEEIEDD